MPGYFDALGCGYGVDNLLAECRSILDLAFVAAKWRYTHLVGQKFYRCGLAEWPPVDAWWTSKLSSATAAGPASSQAAVAFPSPSVAASSSANCLQCEFCGGSSCKLPSGRFQWKHGFAQTPRDRGDHEPGCRRHACCNGGAHRHGSDRFYWVRRNCCLLPLRDEIALWSDDTNPAGARMCVGWKCVARARTTEAGISRSTEGGRQSIRSPMHAFV